MSSNNRKIKIAKKKNKKLSASEKLMNKVKRDHRSGVRRIFSLSGFSVIPGVSDKEIEINGQKGDFDDIFIFENVVVLCEYTASKGDNVSAHLKGKKLLFDKILLDPIPQ